MHSPRGGVAKKFQAQHALVQVPLGSSARDICCPKGKTHSRVIYQPENGEHHSRTPRDFLLEWILPHWGEAMSAELSSPRSLGEISFQRHKLRVSIEEEE